VRTDRVNDNEPEPQPGTVTCPSFLSEEAKAEWERIAPELMRLGLLTPIDRAAFAAYCESYAQWVRAETLLQEKGVLVIGNKGHVIVSPLLWVSSSATKMMLKFGVEFGLTPSSRSRLIAAEPMERDPLDQLLNTRRAN
jgi:P27 family predicted phage terminase small subunit